VSLGAFKDACSLRAEGARGVDVLGSCGFIEALGGFANSALRCQVCEGAAKGKDLAALLKLRAFLVVVGCRDWEFFMSIEFVVFLVIELCKFSGALIAFDSL
jgi:hypothetical protein